MTASNDSATKASRGQETKTWERESLFFIGSYDGLVGGTRLARRRPAVQPPARPGVARRAGALAKLLCLLRTKRGKKPTQNETNTARKHVASFGQKFRRHTHGACARCAVDGGSEGKWVEVGYVCLCEAVWGGRKTLRVSGLRVDCAAARMASLRCPPPPPPPRPPGGGGRTGVAGAGRACC